MHEDALYVLLWEYQVKAGAESRFEQLYGPEGDWARLFGCSEGYLGTELYRDLERPGRYLTLDGWVSEAAFQAFRSQWGNEYQQLDQLCEPLTERETRLGAFAIAGGLPRRR